MSVSRLTSVTAIAGLALASLAIATPASATTIDVAGKELVFGNAVDQYILENAEVDDSYLYENIVTVDGVQVDALVTVLAFSDNSLGSGPYEWLPQDLIDLGNETDPGFVDTPGCYTNADYQYDRNNEIYAFELLDFVPEDLGDGELVEYIDGYEDDPEWENTISTSLSLCDPGFTGTVDGFVDIEVEFQVDGSPVTLENVAINATDIDNGQQVTFWNPAPTTFETSGDDSLVTIEDYSVSDNYVTFTGPEEGNDDAYPDRYVGEVTYASVEAFAYTFRLNDGSSGSLQLAFESYFNPSGDLASTGTDAAPTALAGLAVLATGGALVIARRVRRNRA